MAQGQPGQRCIKPPRNKTSRKLELTQSFTFPARPEAWSLTGGSTTKRIGTVLVFVTGQCTWTTVSDADWIQIVAGQTGVGGGLFQFTAAPNPGGARSGTITVGGQKYVVNQGGR